ncbi:MAG: hypothetical protein ABR909_07175 [Candidatus Bathyarchaeia archaeon]
MKTTKKASLIVILFLLNVCIISSTSPAKALTQAPPIEWQRTFSGDVGYSILQTSDGGYAITGINGSSSLLIRTDSDGNLLWVKDYEIGGTETNLPYIVQTKDGGYALGGTMDNMFLIVKVDSQGTIQWNRTYAYDAPYNSLRALIQTSDGGYALVGTFSPPQTASHAIGEMWFVKTDSLGDMQWNTTIVGPVGNFANTVLQTNDGGYVIFGTSWASDTLPSAFKIIRTDSDGNEQWNRTYGGPAIFSLLKVTLE